MNGIYGWAGKEKSRKRDDGLWIRLRVISTSIAAREGARRPCQGEINDRGGRPGKKESEAVE